MFISKAYAQAVDLATAPSAPAPAGAGTAAGQPLTGGEAFMQAMGLPLVLVVLFYFLLIRPQQKRFKEHSQMLAGLKKGDRVVTGGGLVGVIDKITEGSDEVTVDLGNGMKVTALRSMLQGKNDPAAKKTANDSKPAPAKDKVPKDKKDGE